MWPCLAAAVEAIIILALMAALLYGQPAAQSSNLQTISTQATQISQLRIAAAMATPIPTRCVIRC